MSEEINGYLSAEYQTCQQKITVAVEQLMRIELYIFLAISAFYAWFYSIVTHENAPPETVYYAHWIPPTLCALAWYRSTMQLSYIATISDYLQALEKRLNTTSNAQWELVGWETWFAEEKPSTWNAGYRTILWPSLIIGTALIAWFRVGIP